MENRPEQRQFIAFLLLSLAAFWFINRLMPPAQQRAAPNANQVADADKDKNDAKGDAAAEGEAGEKHENSEAPAVQAAPAGPLPAVAAAPSGRLPFTVNRSRSSDNKPSFDGTDSDTNT